MTTTAKEFLWDVSDFDNWTSERFLPGAIVPEAGNSVQYLTGGWRSDRPVWDEDACTSCLLCWIHCPDSSIIVEERLMTGIDYDHCKGCGICVAECRVDALKMVNETQALAEETAATAATASSAQEGGL